MLDEEELQEPHSVTTSEFCGSFGEVEEAEMVGVALQPSRATYKSAPFNRGCFIRSTTLRDVCVVRPFGSKVACVVAGFLSGVFFLRG